MYEKDAEKEFVRNLKKRMSSKPSIKAGNGQRYYRRRINKLRRSVR